MGGFGCNGNSLGTKVFGALLKDDEYCTFLRGDIIGVITLELIPDWANKKVAELASEQEEIKMEDLK